MPWKASLLVGASCVLACSATPAAPPGPTAMGGSVGVGGGGGSSGGGSDASGGGGHDATGGGGVGAGGGEPFAPVRYRHDALLSPRTAFVAARAREVLERSSGGDDHVFMKVGASGTVSTSFLYCFAGDPAAGYALDLDTHADLSASIDFFRLGDAAGTTPFDRPTLAAEVGRTAAWVQSGSPSPLEQEIAAIDPRVALVNYGTNDMNMGVTYRSALYPFYQSFTSLLDGLSERGIVSIVTGLNPRADSADAALWVPTYNAVVRGVAEARQLPYVNLFEAVVGLADQGLVADGLHGNVLVEDGHAQPCVFTPAGLAFNYNVRNLLTMQQLDFVRRSAIQDEPAPEVVVDEVVGTGTPDDPFVVDRLPFTHAADTTGSAQSAVDEYPSCAPGTNESGPEIWYRLEVEQATALRIAVVDRDDTDVDVHLLDESGSADGCIARADRFIERTVGPGTYQLVVDTWVDAANVPQPGPYLLVVIPCEPGDPDCG